MEDESVLTPTETSEGLDASLFEETPTSELSNEKEETIQIGDAEVPYREVIEAYTNKSNWQKSNTQKAQELAEERRRLEETEQRLLQQEQGLRNYPINQQQTRTPNEQGLSEEDLNDLDPATRTIIQKVSTMEQRVNQWQEDLERSKFEQQLQVEHNRLKSKYADYNGDQVVQSVIKGRDKLEDAYLSDKYKQILSSPENLKSLIPPEMIETIRKEERKKLIEEVQRKQKMRLDASLPQPSKTALSEFQQKEPKDKWDFNKQLLNELKEKGISLTK
ncbi:MAG: hypothetical protein COY53_07245 [Elusimicrobia bacterium CG_4_10_14_0_8_um_filter_37_32]|nr:MAG: hypothetical protein COY53_07245 [Elusimicrobia bacterium CG_4_10_14_0_8_um_filter_37_32]